jgi:CxxC-x17-CxxC domain-containing protein
MDRKKADDSLYRFDASCSRCGKATKVSFQPDGQRPVYCKDCLNLLREEKSRETDARRLAKQAELKKIEEEAQKNQNSGPDAEGFVSLKSFVKQQSVTVEPPAASPSKTEEPNGEMKNDEEIIFE